MTHSTEFDPADEDPASEAELANFSQSPSAHATALSLLPGLARVRVVLMETQHPGNIGSAARAMKNMGLTDLALVNPHRFPDPRADTMASNAKDLLDSAQVFPTLAEALADSSRVYATTSRPRALAVPYITPRQMAENIARQEVSGRISIVFGRERTGLTNTELDGAHELVVIPTGSEYASLNLAAAVQIVSYELSVAAGASLPAFEPHLPVANMDMERFYGHLERILVLTRFLDPNNPRFLMRRLRRLYERAAPDANEMNILRGILTSIEQSHRRALKQAADSRDTSGEA